MLIITSSHISGRDKWYKKMNTAVQVCHLLGEAPHEKALSQLIFSSGSFLSKWQLESAFEYLCNKIVRRTELQLNTKVVFLQHDDTNKAVFLEKYFFWKNDISYQYHGKTCAILKKIWGFTIMFFPLKDKNRIEPHSIKDEFPFSIES